MGGVIFSELMIVVNWQHGSHTHHLVELHLKLTPDLFSDANFDNAPKLHAELQVTFVFQMQI